LKVVKALAAAADGLFGLVGRSVLITGATGALGRSAASALAARGARLTLAGADAESLAALAGELGSDVATVPVRPERPQDVDAMVAAAVAAHGGIDGVLVASGMNHVAPIEAMDVADFEQVMGANVRGSWLVCQGVGRRFAQQGSGGSVVLVSSTRGRLGHPAGYSAYCPSKGAVDMLGRTLAAEWGPRQVRVNVLAPTVFRSDLTAWMYAEDDRGRATREAMLSRIPLGRLAEPADFVGALVYLLSDASSFVTGQVLYLDGGYTAC
jgi:NAD(P)-dependent dehydrogenase (short-subunit alcohol dehydrogenase family)